MNEGTLWWGREMGKSNKRHPTEIRFSPFSLLCLFFIWLGISGLAFYVGMLVGRTEQMREIRTAYRADERAAAEEEFPFLSFEETLSAPEKGEGVESATSGPAFRPADPLEDPSKEVDSTGSVVIQVGSFRKPEGAETLVQELRRKGYRCFLRRPDPSGAGGGYSRVFVGPLASGEMAVKLKEHLEQEVGHKDMLIRSVGKKEELF
jgi:cell division protein FtsN